MYIKKKTFSQERADRLQAEREIMAAKKSKISFDNAYSMCCAAKITTVYNPQSMENEVRTIRVCPSCNSEAPSIEMFNDWEYEKIPSFFIELNQHKTNNK